MTAADVRQSGVSDPDRRALFADAGLARVGGSLAMAGVALAEIATGGHASDGWGEAGVFVSGGFFLEMEPELGFEFGFAAPAAQ